MKREAGILFVLCFADVPPAGKDSKGSEPKGEKGGWDFVCVALCCYVLLLISTTCRQRFQRIRAEG